MWQWHGYDVTLRQSAQASWDHPPLQLKRNRSDNWSRLAVRPAGQWPHVIDAGGRNVVYRRQCYFPAAMLYSRIISTNAPTELTWRHSYDVTDASHSCPSSHAVVVYCAWLSLIIDFTVSSVIIRSGKSRGRMASPHLTNWKYFIVTTHPWSLCCLSASVLSVCHMCLCCCGPRMNEWMNEWMNKWIITTRECGV